MSDTDLPDSPPVQAAVAARPELSRRALLGAAAAGAAGLIVGGIGAPLLPSQRTGASRTAGPQAIAEATHPFFGAHQAGVTTPPQGHLYFAAFDMVDGTDRRDLVRLLRDWSRATERMVQGLEVSVTGALGGDPESPPDDTGEALDLPASRLTVTIGLGQGLFERDGVDRYGIATERPPELERLPPFVGDALDPDRSDGDLCLQVCADDPQVAAHAVRNLSRIAVRRAAIRWSQRGFVRSSQAGVAQPTPRNLMGFKDGTDNSAVDRDLWLPPDSTPAWLAGGTYLVVRKIAMQVEGWDLEPLARQETVFGRAKGSGAPLSGGEEFTAPDFAAKVNGIGAIDQAAHIRLAHPSNNAGIRILRRGYNYVDGTNAQGCLDAGLLFIAFERSPDQYITVQRALATDLLNDFIRHVGSAIFVVPPGPSEGGFVGDTLLG
jgi:deferrochelatase/peroxidase EfeB